MMRWTRGLGLAVALAGAVACGKGGDDHGDDGATGGAGTPSAGGTGASSGGDATGGRATGGATASGGQDGLAGAGEVNGGDGGADTSSGGAAGSGGEPGGGEGGEGATGNGNGAGSPAGVGGAGGGAGSGELGGANPVGGSSGESAGGAGGGSGGVTPAVAPTTPAVARGGDYLGFTEQFNRYYTDPDWSPSQTIYVSPDGTGSGDTPDDPTSVDDGLSRADPGTRVFFTRGSYAGCFELDASQSGTYDEPIVLYAERAADGALGVTIDCCTTGRQTCINLEAADYVAVDGFELVGGYYGVRAVASGLASNEHQRGVAVLDSIGHDQDRDPFFTGASDWFVVERCVGHDTGEGDGHAIYLSNGSDWNIARFNESYATVSSDFQINADPFFGCSDEGIAFDDPECDAVAGSSPTGGRGVSDFMLVEGNYFHDSLAQGPNFTSVRNSVVRNNIIALPARHGTSFWQETDNPRLGSSDNLIAHNLFVTAQDNRHALSFTNASIGNRFENNVVLAVSPDGDAANPSGLLVTIDSTTAGANTFAHNAWIGGYFGSEDAAAPYEPAASELRRTDFDPGWLTDFPPASGAGAGAYRPTDAAPWLDLGDRLAEVPVDRDGTDRVSPVDLGPFER